MPSPKPSVEIPPTITRRENDRFCTFVLNSNAAEIMSRLFTYGAFIADRGDIDGTAKQICVPLQYGNNTYRFDLRSLSDEEYTEFQDWFSPVVEPFLITDTAVVIYIDDETIIYIGDLIEESRKRKKGEWKYK